ncbi:SixA phosphatase family protein [Yinghuangia aomiensis]
MTVLRHCGAVARSGEWDDDADRPLTAAGRVQAERLARILAAFGRAAVLSSPSLRCLETVDPYCRATGTAVEVVPALSEDGHADRASAAGDLIPPSRRGRQPGGGVLAPAGAARAAGRGRARGAARAEPGRAAAARGVRRPAHRGRRGGGGRSSRPVSDRGVNPGVRRARSRNGHRGRNARLRVGERLVNPDRLPRETHRSTARRREIAATNRTVGAESDGPPVFTPGSLSPAVCFTQST